MAKFGVLSGNDRAFFAASRKVAFNSEVSSGGCNSINSYIYKMLLPAINTREIYKITWND